MVRRGVFAVVLAVHLVALYTPKTGALPSPVIGTDKLVHMALFGSVLYAGAWAGLAVRPMVVALVANAGISEITQYLFLARRSGDVWDAVADVIGIGLALLALRRWPVPRAPRQEPA